MTRHSIILSIVCFIALNLPIPPSLANGPIAGNTYALDISGPFAHIGIGEQLIVFNITNSMNPIALGETDLLGDSIQDIDVRDNLAFLATGSAGLQIIDVSNPNHPTKIGHYKTPGFLNGVFVSDNLLYLTAGSAGLLVMDITRPQTPTLVAVSKTTGWDKGVFVSEGFAYVAADEDGVRVVDVSTPQNPVTIGTIPTPNDANDVFVDGTLLFVAAGSGGLQIVDIHDPPEFKEVSVKDTGYSSQVIVESGFAYVATEREGIAVLDITKPETPRLIHRIKARGSANYLAVQDEALFVADGIGGLLSIHISNDRRIELRRNFASAPKRVITRP